MREGKNDAFFRTLVERHEVNHQQDRIDPVLHTKYEPQSIHGIPLLSQFDITLDGTVDNIKFGPLPGILIFGESKTPGQDISLTLGVIPFSGGPVGSIVFMPSGPAWRLKLSEGRIDVTLKEGDAAGVALQWKTLETPGDPAQEPTAGVPAKADLSLAVTGERIEGNLNAQGYLVRDATRPSRYTATIKGALHRRPIVEAILSSVDVLPMSGHWHTDAKVIGDIALHASGNRRTGRFGTAGAETLDGELDEGLLSFSSTLADNRHGRGFLRPLWGGNLAVGMWDADAAGENVVPLLADQPQQPLNLKSADVPPESIDEVQAIGRDLADQGKCQQALAVLDRVWGFWEPRGRSKDLPDTDVVSALVNASGIINPMIQCAFDLGLYARTVDYLRKDLEIEREQHPVERAKALFADRVHGFAKELRDQADNFSRLRGNLALLTTPKIGISFDPKPGQDLLVTAVTPDGPAAKAGLREGDRIVSIDGRPTRGAKARELMETFGGGAEGTSVRLVVATGDTLREILVVREPWYRGIEPQERRAAVEQGINAMRALDERLAAVLITQADDLAAFQPKVAKDGTGLDAEFDRILDRLARQQAELRGESERLIALGEALFGTWDRYMPRQRWLINSLRILPDSGESIKPFSPDTAQKPLGVIEDEMVAELSADPTKIKIDGGLFYEHFKSVAIIILMEGLLTQETQSLSQVKAHVQDVKERLRQEVYQVADLSRWLERSRGRLALDAEKIAALDLGEQFYKEWIGFLWDLEGDLGEQSATTQTGPERVMTLLATETARNRAAQDLFASREQAKTREPESDYGGFTSLVAQAPLTLDKVVNMVRKRGGVTVAYYPLTDRLLVWVLNSKKLACECKVADDRFSDEIKAFIKANPSRSPDWTEIKCKCEGITARELPVSEEEINALEAGFQSMVDPESRGIYSAQDIVSLLHGLHQKLVEPISDLLPEDPETVVTIVPYGKLLNIPFGALITKTAEAPSKPHYLIQDHPLAYLPSIGMMLYTQQNAADRAAAEKAANRDFVAFLNPKGSRYCGPPPFDTKDKALTDDVLRGLGKNWSGFYPDARSDVFVGEAATLENAMNFAAKAGILTFLAHATARGSPGGGDESLIWLADNQLVLNQVNRLNLSADLVILAGCMTGRGEIGADGVIGLSRAFTFRGASSLIMSLWEVPGGDTLMLVDRLHWFYGHEHLPKARALQMAQIEMIKKDPKPPQPNLWAGMVLFGEP